MARRGRAKGTDPIALNEDELDLEIGYLQEELADILREIDGLGVLDTRLKARRAELRTLIRQARNERRSRP